MKKLGFTLIELLIVVAIIAILAAIAVPNFMEAQARAKVSRVKADIRSLGTAMECYQVDNNMYPWSKIPSFTYGQASHYWLYIQFDQGTVVGSYGAAITTPIAYIATIPLDPFTTRAYNGTPYPGWPGKPLNASCLFVFGKHWDYIRGIYGGVGSNYPLLYQDVGYALYSIGPSCNLFWSPPTIYDPTNGTMSPGEIWYVGRGVGWVTTTGM